MAPSETRCCTTFWFLLCLAPLQLHATRNIQWVTLSSDDVEYKNGSDIPLDPRASLSLQWVEHLDRETLHDLKASVGVEVYDSPCTEHIVHTLTSTSEEQRWWLKALDEDPVVKGYMERKSNKEINDKWDEAFKDETGFFAFLAKAWQWIKNCWKRLKRWIASGRGPWTSGGAIKKFRKKLAAIANNQVDDDGKPATVCSLDHATLKLFPFSRAFHRGVHEHDTEQKCAVGHSKNSLGLRHLGRMDVDRVIRATQMALYQTCYYRCVRFVEQNFEKTIAHNGKNGDKAFCTASYDDQQKRMKGPAYETFLKELLNNKESDIYRQCQALFDGIDGAELIDFTLERACLKFPRPTPFYVPSENAPLDLYNTITPYNERVCRPERAQYAENTLHRTCPEGTHCHCQRKPMADHITNSQKSWKVTKIFNWNAWGGVKHCTARRKAGTDALIYVDADNFVKTKWYHVIHHLSHARKTTKIGIGLLLVSAVLGTMAAAIAGSASAGGAVAAGTGFASFFGSIGAGIAGFGTAVAAANPVSLLIGGSIVFGVAGLYVIQWGLGFDCAKGLGCYPLDCKFERSLNGGQGQCYMAPPKHGATNMPLWWLPPPSLKCAYKGKRWYRNIGLGDGQCLLEACSSKEIAAGQIGYFKSAKSKKNKLDFQNCQPVNVKDMSVHQQHKLLETLRGDDRIKETLKFVNVPNIPECTMNEHCRDGLQITDDWSAPFCHHKEHVCYNPVVTHMEVEVNGVTAEDWQDRLQKSFANMLFKNNAQDGEHLLKIIEEPAFSLVQVGQNITKVDTNNCNPMKKKFRLIIKAAKGDGLDSSTVRSTFRRLVGHVTTSSSLNLVGVLGRDFQVKIVEAGALCPPRILPEHATATCASPVRTGGGCQLTCHAGWIAASTTWCDDGTWVDEMPESQWPAPPGGFSLPPLLECQEVPCAPLVFPNTCPRAERGCFQWKDSACDRGGLSGSQPICEVEPSEGYKLADPASNKWRCEPSGNWVLPEGLEEPKMKEAKCTFEGFSREEQEDAGIVDWDSGVDTLCESAYSGIVDREKGPGFCDVTCKPGTQLATEDPLRCTAERRWTGKARCEPVHCGKVSELLATHDMTTISDFNCPDKVQAGAKAGVCQVECEVGYDLIENDIRCTKDGHFTGLAVCIDDDQKIEYYQNHQKIEKSKNGVHRPHPPVLGLLTYVAVAATWRR